MATNIDLYIDLTSGYLRPLGSATQGFVPDLTNGDIYNLRLRLQEINELGNYIDINPSGYSARIGIGFLDNYPTSGDFVLTRSGPVTSSTISYNATTAQVLNAVSGIAGNVAVTTYGSSGSAWLITAATPNTALSFGGNGSNLFPTSSVIISNRRTYSTAVCAQQIIQLKRNPAVFSDSFTQSATAGQASFNKIQDGGSGINEAYSLVLGQDVAGGSVIFGFGSTNTSTAVPALSSNSVYQAALSAITGIGTNNISVESGNSDSEKIISFVKSLGQTNITTALSADLGGLVFAPYLQATVTMGTAELEELFFEEGTDAITPKIEIEISSSGDRKTAIQNDVVIRKQLVQTESVVPADFASYYTKAEADAAFVEDSTSNVDATNRRLKNASGNTIVDYGISSFGNGGMVDLNGSVVTVGSYPIYATSSVTVGGAVSLGGSLRVASTASFVGAIGFFGSAAITQPNNPNVVSNVISLGLIPSSATYGVLPSSIRTLTVTASLDFGTIGGGTSVEKTITVTGAVVNDIVSWGVPASVATGLIFDSRVSAADTVALRAFNVDNQSHSATTATYRILVIGY